jgi:Zn finger protein HypA/HybF involved in hydrogenase expression
VHELAAAQLALRAALAEADARGAKRVVAVEVVAGALEGFGAVELREAFRIEALGTAAEGAALRIRRAAPKGYCSHCRAARKVKVPTGHFHGPPSLSCPRCGRALELSGGRGFSVARATLDV